MQGRDKIPLLLAEKGQDLLKQLVPYVIQMAIQAGIENIGTPNVKLPTTCLVPDELSKMLALRNNLVSQLNAGVKVITTLSKVLDPLNLSVTTGVKSLNTVNVAITAAQILASLSPVPPPGSMDPANSILVGIDKSNKFLTNTVVPNLQKAKNTVSAISISLDFTNKTLLSLIGLLNSIDMYLKGCKVEGLDALDDYLITLQQVQQQTKEIENTATYKGFTLEVVTEAFSPTVNRNKAVAKNNQGIILLQTPLSFTTVPQILIAELKLIIDSSNLKAN
jgi:hypothetical protein